MAMSSAGSLLALAMSMDATQQDQSDRYALEMQRMEETPVYLNAANKLDCTGLAPVHWAARTGSWGG